MSVLLIFLDSILFKLQGRRNYKVMSHLVQENSLGNTIAHLRYLLF